MDTDPATTHTALADIPAARPARRRRAVSANPFALYCEAVRRAALRLAKGRPFEVDDIAQRVVLKAVSRGPQVMVDYADPVDFARLCVGKAGADHRRQERVQRCEGAKGGRKTVVWDFRDEERQRAGTADAFGDPADIVVGQVAAEEILALVDRDVDRELLKQRGLYGSRVTEIAADRGVSHTGISRRLSATNRRLRELLASGDYVPAS